MSTDEGKLVKVGIPQGVGGHNGVDPDGCEENHEKAGSLLPYDW